ncbi:hypothetical protein [Hamadaea tsunoensis]|uniref:hypothetical protein n=1 Tax=Hamadaea tsunoensis TaxID=53368 RepID=UPI00040982DC|nr:hypothetical protein [Hamadaea tsunoensis]
MMERDELSVLLRTGPFHLALRAAIDARGLALQRIQHRLAEQGVSVGVATLSYWQSGRRRPESLPAVQALEGILGLAPGALTTLLGPRGVPAGGRRYADLMFSGDEIERIVGDLDPATDGRLHTLMFSEEVELGADRSAVRRSCRQVLTAHQEADRYVTVVQGEPGCDAARLEIVPGLDCRLGRVRRSFAGGFLVAELIFDRLLRAGDTHVLDYEVVDRNGLPATEYWRGVRFPARLLVLRVRFHPEALPVRCYRFARKHAHGADVSREELTLSGHRTVHIVEPDLTPGIIGVHWDWT